MSYTKKYKKQSGGTKKATDKKVKEVKEFEAKFLDIDLDLLYKKLKALGGVKKQENTIFRRSVFNLCDIKRGYVRVRDEGNKVTNKHEFRCIIKNQKGRRNLEQI